MRRYSQKLLNLIELRKTHTISSALKNKKLKNDLIVSTNFLNYDASSTDRLYYVEHNLFTQVRCPVCNKKTKLKYIKKKYEIKCCSYDCTVSRMGPSGLTRAQEIAQKAANTMNEIDTITGLSTYDKSAIKTKKALSQIDTESGLSKYQINAQHALITKSNTIIDGLNTLQRAGIKAKTTKLNADINAYTNIAEKSACTMKKINGNTGLTKYQENGIKIKASNSKINKESGLSNYQENGKKSAIYQRLSFYNKLCNRIPKDLKILTTPEEYKVGTDQIIKYQCNKCNSVRESNFQCIRCTTCYPYNKSIAENEVLEYCQSLSSNVLSNSRSIITPQELDIYLPDHNLAIEYNGLFWHSSYSTETENKKYHLIKTEKCQEQDIQLFHIFENEWIDPIKQKIWKSIIKNRLGQSSRIYARKTKVAQITSKDKTQFLLDNHLQGDCASSINLGLYLGDELVSVMTFGKSRYNKKVDWELLRFCNKLETSTVGGAGKLLASFRRENDGSIISYADKRRSAGGLYKVLGFEMSHESKPNYFYWKKGSMELESRVKYQKHKLEKVLDVFDSSKTETENMYVNSYRKIYDCGNQVWKIG